jgi:hypothetical protein
MGLHNWLAVAHSLEYDTVAHAAGVIATNTIAAASVNGFTSDGIVYSNGGLLPATALTGVVEKGLYLSNPTAVFTGGTGGSAIIHVWYSVVSV